MATIRRPERVRHGSSASCAQMTSNARMQYSVSVRSHFATPRVEHARVDSPAHQNRQISRNACNRPVGHPEIHPRCRDQEALPRLQRDAPTVGKRGPHRCSPSQGRPWQAPLQGRRPRQRHRRIQDSLGERARPPARPRVLRPRLQCQAERGPTTTDPAPRRSIPQPRDRQGRRLGHQLEALRLHVPSGPSPARRCRRGCGVPPGSALSIRLRPRQARVRAFRMQARGSRRNATRK
jgi:hypothetical protein